MINWTPDSVMGRAGIDSFEATKAFQAFANAYGEDPDLRSRVDTNPTAVLAEMGVETPSGVELRVLMNTEDTFYLPFPPDPNVALADEMLDHAAGGKTASTAGSAGSVSSLGTVASTSSTAASASSAGSAGCAG